ncbi:C40 family peptidase [Candidatus Protofrankia datiscae]|uniref:NLP/P60 protein n=1 Tax=Candidatus Protofrankia datiscae TaxID=2716812 RepID=F8B1E5_9ACTN|nr:NLP/P60 protein [Candidatus Protofrankia datiscae]
MPAHQVNSGPAAVHRSNSNSNPGPRRGRHRAPTTRSTLGRISARTAVAAAATGTVALSGLASPALANDRGLDTGGTGRTDAATTSTTTATSTNAARSAAFTITPAATTGTGTLAAQPVSFSTSSASGFGAKLVYLASKQAGKPYVWGAEGPRAFDCSGLVRYIYKQLGRSVPRTANAQYNASQKLSKNARQPGDLIFFGRPGGIHHVGVYAGNGMMWASPHTGAVVRLQKVYTSNYLVGRIR